MRRAVAGAAVSSEEGCSSTGAVERGGAAAGTGEGAGIALGHKSKTGYLGVRRNQRGQDSQESGHTRRRCGAVART